MVGACCNCSLLVLQEEVARWFWDVEVMVEMKGVNKTLQLCLQPEDMRDAGQSVDGQPNMNASAFISCTMQHC